MKRLTALMAILMTLVIACGGEHSPQDNNNDAGTADASTVQDADSTVIVDLGPAECEAFQFNCMGYLQCIHHSKVCDGVNDCRNGLDEDYCGECPAGYIECGDGECINGAFVCDRVLNCSDGSDESYCPER